MLNHQLHAEYLTISSIERDYTNFDSIFHFIYFRKLDC